MPIPYYAAGVSTPNPEDVAEYRRVIRELRQIRRAQDMTQAEIARRIGSTQTHVSYLESGSRQPTLATLQRYARAVGARLVVGVERLEVEPAGGLGDTT
jgi:transcriptional regulator with XRE-family HTH domain